MASSRRAASRLQHMRVIELWNRPVYIFGGSDGPEPSRSTLDEERCEVLQSVWDAMRTAQPDADRTAACSYLLRHLVGVGPAAPESSLDW